MSPLYPPIDSKTGFKIWVLIKNAFSVFMGTFFVSFLGFLLTPFLIHHLGNDRYGVWIFVFSFVSILELSDFGISQGVQRYVAQYVAKGQSCKIEALTNQAFTLVLLTMLVVSIPFALIDWLFLPVFKVPQAIHTETQWSMALLMLSMVVSVPMAVLSGVIVGYQKYDLLNINWILFSIARAVAFVISAFMPMPLLAMAFSFTILSYLRMFSINYLIRHLCPGYRLGLLRPTKSFMSELGTYGGKLFSISIMSRVIYTSDNFLLTAMLSPTWVTFYSIGAKWTEICRGIITGIMQVCFPAFSHLSTINDKASIRNILLHGSRGAVGVGVLVSSLLILLAEPIIFLWMGKGYAFYSAPVMRWLCLVLVLNNFAAPFDYYLKATDNTRPLIMASVFNCIINILASIYFIKRIGMVGVVWGTIVGLAPTVLLIIIPEACRITEISLMQLYRQLMAPLLLPFLWVFGLGFWFHFHPPFKNTLMDTIFWAIGITISYLLLWMISDPIPRRLLKALKLKT